MEALDITLMDRAEPHFLDAFATFDRGDGDLVRVAQEIAMAGQMAGFTKRGRRRMLDYLFAFIETLNERGIDPIQSGERLADPSVLFSQDRLGGLFNKERPAPEPSVVEFFPPEDGSPLLDRALIDQLIAETELYATSGALKELFDFVSRMKNMAAFNAMLLHVQKPAISHAMTAGDWWERFRRRPKEGARPLVVLRNFGPVSFVYDVLDTEGEPLPDAAFSFPTAGRVPNGFMRACETALTKNGFRLIWLDKGDMSAGFARRVTHHTDPRKVQTFEIGVNRNHDDATQVVTLLHELAHVFLGHCGPDPARKIKPYRPGDLALREVEAESVAYVTAKRSGLSPRSDSYLDTYKGALDDLDVHRVLTCVSRIEGLLGMPFFATGVQNDT